MTDTAANALKTALQVLDLLVLSDTVDDPDVGYNLQLLLPNAESTISAADLRSEILRGLESLRQGPAMLDVLAVDKRLRAASVKAGSDAALAAAMGITRQSLADVMSGKRQPGPAVLGYLKLRKIAVGRTLYTPVEDHEVKPKAPRSERRQRAWDGPAGAVTDSVVRM